MMHRTLFGFATLAALLMGQSAQASAILGSAAIGGAVTGTNQTATTQDIKTATTVNFAGFSFQSGTNNFIGFGLFAPTGSASVLSPIVVGANTFTFGNASFGTFTATALVFDDNTTALARNVYFTGSFAPGSFYNPPFTTNTATLQIGFTQQGGPGTAISASLSLNTPGVPPPNAVPEPATFLAALLGVVPFVIARRRRLA